MSRVPSLLELCLTFLVENMDDVETLEGIDSALKADLLARVLKNFNYSSLGHVLKLLDENTSSLDLSQYTFNLEMPFDKLFSKMKSLTTLNICGNLNLNDKVTENIIRYCPTLKVINLYKNPRITDRSLELVRAHCPNLEILHSRYCIGISGAAFCSEFLSGENDVLNKTDKSRQSKKVSPPRLPPLPFFSNLVELDISECKSIVPAKLIPLDRLFPSLQTLAIGKLFLGDEDAEAIIKTAPATLANLDISFNPISSKAILALCAPTKRNQFTSLNFKSCRCISNTPDSASFANILRDLPRLTWLDLSQCYQIGETDFARLTSDELRGELVKELRHLDVSNCGGITTKTIEHLSTLGLARSLKELRLSGCEKISDSILTSLPGWFPNLEFVDLYGSDATLSVSKTSDFHAAHPKIQFRTGVANYLKPKKN